MSSFARSWLLKIESSIILFSVLSTSWIVLNFQHCVSNCWGLKQTSLHQLNAIAIDIFTRHKAVLHSNDMSRRHCWCGHKGKVRAQIWISKWWTEVDLSGGLTSCIKLRLSPVSWEGRDVICEELLSLSQRKLYSRIKVFAYHSPLLKKFKKLVIFLNLFQTL